VGSWVVTVEVTKVVTVFVIVGCPEGAIYTTREVAMMITNTPTVRTAIRGEIPFLVDSKCRNACTLKLRFFRL